MGDQARVAVVVQPEEVPAAADGAGSEDFARAVGNGLMEVEGDLALVADGRFGPACWRGDTDAEHDVLNHDGEAPERDWPWTACAPA